MQQADRKQGTHGQRKTSRLNKSDLASKRTDPYGRTADLGEGLQNFSNKFAEDIIAKAKEEEDYDVVDLYRKSIYNFNRKGAPKTKVRAQIFDKVRADSDEDDTGGVDPGEDVHK